LFDGLPWLLVGSDPERQSDPAQIAMSAQEPLMVRHR
jgi:hypothetical protein